MEKFVKTNFLYIAIVGVLAYFAFSFKRGIVGVWDGLGDIKDDVDHPLDSAARTISDLQARNCSEILYAAMLSRNPFTGTDFDGIKKAFDILKNSADFAAVYNAFGKRQYSLFFGNEGDPLVSGKHDLLVWLGNELSTSQVEYIKENYAHLNIY